MTDAGSAATADPLDELERTALALLDELVSFARPRLPSVADRLKGEGRRLAAGGPVTVVVAGEAKRGKSSLINGLLGHPGLSPEDIDVCTATHIAFHYAARPVARVHREGADALELRPESLRPWATGQGAGNGDGPSVLGIEVGLDAPLLAGGLQLIDTPGVGGLIAAHAAVTLVTVERADALVFVADAAAPLTRPELDFLGKVTAETTTVLVAVAKADLYSDDAVHRIIEDDRALLRERGSLLAEAAFVPVSSHLRTSGAASEDVLLAESGLGQLETWLRDDVVGEARLVRLHNMLGRVRALIRILAVPEHAVQNAGSSSAYQALRQAEQKLDEMRKQSARWRVRLSDEFQDLGMALRTQIGRDVSTLRARYEERVTKWDERVRTRLGDELLTELRAVSARLDISLGEGTGKIAARLADEFAVPELAELIPTTPSASDLEGILDAVTPTGRRADLVGVLSAGSYLYMGSRLVGAGAHLGAASLLAPLLGPAGLVVGGVVATVVLRGRLRGLQQQEARAIMQRTLADATTELRSDLDRRLVHAQRATRDALEATFESLLSTAREARDRQHAAAAASEQQRAREQQAAGARLTILRRLDNRTTACLSTLDSFRSRSQRLTTAAEGSVL